MERVDPFASRDVECPYCGETVELTLEADVAGELVVDCEVCCNPWRVRIVRAGEELAMHVTRLDE